MGKKGYIMSVRVDHGAGPVVPSSNLADRVVAGILTTAKVAAAVATVAFLYAAPAPTLGFVTSLFFNIDTAEKTDNKTLERAISAACVIGMLGAVLALFASGAGTAFYLTAHAINLSSFAFSVYTRANSWYHGSLR